MVAGGTGPRPALPGLAGCTCRRVLENPASDDISWPRLSCVKYQVRRAPVSGSLEREEEA